MSAISSNSSRTPTCRSSRPTTKRVFSRTGNKTGPKNLQSVLDGFANQFGVELTSSQIRAVVKLWANAMLSPTGTSLHYHLQGDEVFIDGSGI